MFKSNIINSLSTLYRSIYSCLCLDERESVSEAVFEFVRNWILQGIINQEVLVKLDSEKN